VLKQTTSAAGLVVKSLPWKLRLCYLLVSEGLYFLLCLTLLIDQAILRLLVDRRSELLALKGRWVGSLASEIRFDTHVHTAAEVASRITSSTQHSAESTQITWLQPLIGNVPTQHRDPVITWDDDPSSANDKLDLDGDLTNNKGESDDKPGFNLSDDDDTAEDSNIDQLDDESNSVELVWQPPVSN
jgi:hypothetical protein